MYSAGKGYDSILDVVQIFDPATNTWNTPVVSGLFPLCSGQTTAVVNGLIYVIGGEGDAGDRVDYSFLEVFDPGDEYVEHACNVRYIHSANITRIGGCERFDLYDGRRIYWRRVSQSEYVPQYP